MGVERYKTLLKNLLPQGLAWPRQKDTNMDGLLTAFAVDLNRTDLRVKNMLTESYPLTTTELLTDWERVAGLPEECEGLGETLQARREAVHRKVSSLGGQNPDYYIAVAASIGYEVTITEFKPFRAGVGAVGDSIYGEEWLFTWAVNAPEETIRYFRAGQSTAGEGLRSWGNELLECVISRIAPAHTLVQFRYGS